MYTSVCPCRDREGFASPQGLILFLVALNIIPHSHFYLSEIKAKIYFHLIKRIFFLTICSTNKKNMSNFFGKYVQKANGYIFPKKKADIFRREYSRYLQVKGFRPCQEDTFAIYRLPGYLVERRRGILV